MNYSNQVAAQLDGVSQSKTLPTPIPDVMGLEQIDRNLTKAMQVCAEWKDLDVPENITVFSARLYGSRSRKNQKLLDSVRCTVEAAQC